MVQHAPLLLKVVAGKVSSRSCLCLQAAYFANYGGLDGAFSPSKSRNLLPSRHLWIGGLVNATRADVLDVFGVFGPIEHFKFIKGRRCAFVDFVNQVCHTCAML
jgi:hypothetical protein